MFVLQPSTYKQDYQISFVLLTFMWVLTKRFILKVLPTISFYGGVLIIYKSKRNFKS